MFLILSISISLAATLGVFLYDAWRRGLFFVCFFYSSFWSFPSILGREGLSTTTDASPMSRVSFPSEGFEYPLVHYYIDGHLVLENVAFFWGWGVMKDS